MAVAVDSVLDLLGDVNGGAQLLVKSAGATTARLDVPRSLKRGLTPLGIKLSLCWAGLDGRSLVAVLPLVNEPAHPDASKAYGDQDYGGDEPLFHGVLLSTPHYNRERSKENAGGI